MNKLVLIFAFLNFLIIFSNLLRWFFIFKPPSVVISFLFSGTKHIKFGFILSALSVSYTHLRAHET